MIPINLYLRLQALQRQSPKLFATVKALVGNQAQIEYPGGVRVMVSNPIAARSARRCLCAMRRSWSALPRSRM